MALRQLPQRTLIRASAGVGSAGRSSIPPPLRRLLSSSAPAPASSSSRRAAAGDWATVGAVLAVGYVGGWMD